MIFGNPDSFALQFDIVDGWNVPGDIWRNGIFSMYLGGGECFILLMWWSSERFKVFIDH
jgi:hypothetical protein